MSPGSLLERVARALDGGPMHTLDVARSVLGLRGNPGAASAAVFTLLGPDGRFRVDGDGVWSLSEPGARVGSFRQTRFAVVDVETTGGSPRRGHRITEIAIVDVADGVLADAYHTLVNPGRGIPQRISSLTGITDRMVSGAPYFDAIADRVLERLQGRVFVAHNARFDWRFVSSQLADAVGEVPVVERLCTVRMARRLLPELRRRNLDAVTDHLGVDVTSRHRALGDAEAAARVLIRLLDRAEARGLADLTALRGFLER